MDNFFVIKANGTKELFDEGKLRTSIGRAGIGKDIADEVVAHIKTILYSEIPTNKIYSHIIEFLGKSSDPRCRTRYSLKQAIMKLGPAGYAFEDYVAKILAAHGYQTKTRQTIWGKCVSHEIDVVAEKDGKKILVECKFHNQPGTRSDIKVMLYVKARFEDLADQFNEVWLVTNTKCTTDAIKYAECAGVKIIAWGYPPEGNLQQLIEEKNLYPDENTFN